MLRYYHSFKNQNSQKTGKGIDYWFYGLTKVESMMS